MKLTRKAFVKSPTAIKEEQQVCIFSILFYLVLTAAVKIRFFLVAGDLLKLQA